MSSVAILFVLLVAAEKPASVCEINVPRGKVTIRGMGGLSRDGPFLCDYTCPLVIANGFILPRAILIDQTVQQDPSLRNIKQGDIFQAVIEGEIECRVPILFKRSDDGDVVGGSGFGSLGLFNCRMRNARSKVIHFLSDDWGNSIPGRR